MLVGVVVVVTAACADGDAQRQFANDPPAAATLRLPTMAAPPTATTRHVGGTSTAAPAASPEMLLAAPNAASRIYFRAGTELWTMSVADGRPTRVLGGDGEVRAIAASPSGDRVASLLATADGDGETTTLVVAAADGRELRREPELERFLATANRANGEARPRSLDWSARDDRLLVSFAPGGLLAVPLDGDPQLLIDDAQAAAPADAAWSPAGDAIAYLDPALPGEETGLYVAPTGATPLDPVPVVASAPNRPRSVSGLAWLPDGSGLLYAEAEIDSRVASGGDLFQISASGENPRLVAGASAAAPAARIARFAPSPTGQAVAYTVFAPSPDGLAFHSLWIQQLGANARYRLDVPEGEVATDLWWTSAGLVWRTVDLDDAAEGTAYADGRFALYRADSSAAPDRLAEVDPELAATPIASPAASPQALPVASPVGGAGT